MQFAILCAIIIIVGLAYTFHCTKDIIVTIVKNHKNKKNMEVNTNINVSGSHNDISEQQNIKIKPVRKQDIGGLIFGIVLICAGLYCAYLVLLAHA